jgi:hypothetical protein
MTRSFLFAASAVLGIAACAVLPDVPANLVPRDETPVGRLAARGVQIYECRVAGDGRAAWAFVAPRADLFDDHGRPAGEHGAGPFWRATDGSRIVGTVRVRADAPRAADIPWLQLATRPADGQPGLLDRVTSILRVNTVGGIAPAEGCDAARQGRRVEVAYAADYLLYAAMPARISEVSDVGR